MDIIMIMRKAAIGFAALTIAIAGSTLSAAALPGESSLGVAQSVGHADNNNIDKVFFRRRRAVVGLSSTISSYRHMDSIAESSSTSMYGSGPHTALSPISRLPLIVHSELLSRNGFAEGRRLWVPFA
jgi:hypothetical protein